MLWIAESATGYLVGMNVLDVVPRHQNHQTGLCQRRTKGNAGGSLTDEQVQQIKTWRVEKGKWTFAVKLTDAEAKEPVLAEMVWAWTPKKR